VFSYLHQLFNIAQCHAHIHTLPGIPAEPISRL
jgi:hypothetical protein